MKEKIKIILKLLLETSVIVSIVIFSVMPVSCKITESGIQILGGDYKPPQIQKVIVEDANTVSLYFSEEVKLDVNVISCGEDHNVGSNVSYDESKTRVSVIMEEEMEIGKSYELFGCVTDETGNSLTFLVPFKGYNSHVPKMIITEFQTESVSSQRKDEKAEGIYRNEYVEFVALSAGNLAGLEFVSANDGEEAKFEFPPVEVKQGEVLVLHLRNRGNGCINENESNLSLAYSGYSTNGVRDLWSESETTALGNKTDIILLRNSADESILDCVMYREEKVTEWGKKFEGYADLVSASGIYEGGELEYAMNVISKSNGKVFLRTDVRDVLKEAKNNPDFKYPVGNSGDLWTIGESSAGTL